MDIERYQPFFGKWQLEDKIGSGAFGSVYSIFHYENGVKLTAAMKVVSLPKNESDITKLRAQGMDDGQIRAYYDDQSKMIINEIQIMNVFRGSDHIVCYEDHQLIRQDNGLGWHILIRMEKLERLNDYLKRIRAKRSDVLKVWCDITNALISCRKKQVVHRDIKPDNILVSSNGYYKLVDFGIAKNLEENVASTTAGTYPYMAPEVQERRKYDGRCDIYSLGIVIYQLFNANRYPFLPPYPDSFSFSERDEAIGRRMRGEKIPDIPGLPPQIMRIIHNCAAFKPEDRYQTPEKLRDELSALRISYAEANAPVYGENGELVSVSRSARKGARKKGGGARKIIIAMASLIFLLALFLVIYFGFIA